MLASRLQLRRHSLRQAPAEPGRWLIATAPGDQPLLAGLMHLPDVGSQTNPLRSAATWPASEASPSSIKAQVESDIRIREGLKPILLIPVETSGTVMASRSYPAERRLEEPVLIVRTRDAIRMRSVFWLPASRFPCLAASPRRAG